MTLNPNSKPNTQATDASAKAAFDTAEEQLKSINNQFQQKEKQTNAIMKEQKRRQSTLMQKRFDDDPKY